ncbi:MAG: glycosyltransferase [Chitinophagaceae bacterium]
MDFWIQEFVSNYVVGCTFTPAVTFAPMIANLILIGLLLVVAIQVAVLGGVYFKLFSLSKDVRFEPEFDDNEACATLFVSVIICAKNEAENLKSFLPKILAQNYRYLSEAIAFEVVVVNDASDDATGAVLNELATKNRHLKIVTIDAAERRGFPGKKFALSRGIAIASGNWIVCTDADCEPASEMWLHYMVAPFRKDKRIIAGFGGYKRTSGWLNIFIRYETMHTFFSLYAFAKAGLPYMAVGRNMAFTKEDFAKAEANPTWEKLPSGDDDLLVSLCATKQNFDVVAYPESFTWSDAKSSLKEYVAQKQRHVSTGKYYPKKIKALLGLFALSIALWWPLLLLFCLYSYPNNLLIFVGFLLPIMFYVGLMQFGAKQLRERTNLLGWLGFLLCWTIYNVVLAPYILWKNKMHWK